VRATCVECLPASRPAADAIDSHSGLQYSWDRGRGHRPPLLAAVQPEGPLVVIRRVDVHKQRPVRIVRRDFLRSDLTDCQIRERVSDPQLPVQDPSLDCGGCTLGVDRTERMEPVGGAGHDGVNAEALGHEPTQERRRQERHIARDHQHPAAHRRFDCRVDATERPAARQQIRDDADTGRWGTAVGICGDEQDRGGNLAEDRYLAIENLRRPDTESTLVASAEAPGPSARENGCRDWFVQRFYLSRKCVKLESDASSWPACTRALPT
jgi:hypothetical protein